MGAGLDALRRALAQVDGSFTMIVLPRGFRLFEVAQAGLKAEEEEKKGRA